MLHFLLFILISLTSLPNLTLQSTSPQLLDSVIQTSAFHSFPKQHKISSTLYKVNLPSNLSTIKANVLMLRATTLYKHGTFIQEFKLPAGIFSRTQNKRLIIIRQNLANFSYIYNATYKNALGNYTIVTPVLGILFYDACNHLKNATEVDIVVSLEPIRVNFSTIDCFQKLYVDRLKCAMFELNGNVSFSNVSDGSVCMAWDQGHFAIVAPLEWNLMNNTNNATNGRPGTNSSNGYDESYGTESSISRRWKMVFVSVLGVVAIFLVGLVVVALVAKAKKKNTRMAELERIAYEEEALQMSMVGHVRAPTANAARTAPAIENDYDVSF